MRGRVLAVLLAVWVLASGCRSPSVDTAAPDPSASGWGGDLTPQEVIDGHKRWLEHRPESYTMTVGLGCFCAGAGTWAVEVDGESVSGELQDRVFDESYGDDEPPTIDVLYRRALYMLDPDGEYMSSELTLTGIIDEQGVPWRMSVDFENVFDEELTWSIRAYEPVTDPGG